MRTITEKEKFNIAVLLASKVDDTDASKPFVAAANMNALNVKFKDSAFENWFSIVTEAIKQDTLPDLIKVVLDRYKDEQLLKILDELKTGYIGKLQMLAKAIYHGRCILFLGPGTLLTNQGGVLKPFNQLLTELLAKKLSNGVTYYDPDQQNNLAYMAQRFYRLPNKVAGEVGAEANTLFKKVRKENALYERVLDELKDFPWKLIINTNPDTILADKINSQTPGSCLVGSYLISNNVGEKDGGHGDTQPPQEDQALFYNLFGSFKDPLSILYTDSDFLRFVTKVIGRCPPLHSYVTAKFDEEKYYLFLGFDFDQWYFKVLAKTLNLVNKEDRAFSLYPGEKKINESNIDFFEQEFKFYFVNDEIDQFLKLLTDAYKEVAAQD